VGCASAWQMRILGVVKLRGSGRFVGGICKSHADRSRVSILMEPTLNCSRLKESHRYKGRKRQLVLE